MHRELQAASAAVAGLLDAIPTTMVMDEMPSRRATHVLFRGQYDQPRDRVGPGIPACLSTGPKPDVLDRLALARWLVSPANPLTARVAVNRDWQMFFGTGLVKTVDDFGAQGEPASHPELLDWLALAFVDSGWDMKRMLRLIATSAAYRRSSKRTSEGLEHDPENRLLAHAPRLRLPAEMIRDQALRLAGLLVERTGGPSVKPYQPAGLWNELADADYVQDHGASLYRRSLYTFWKRTVPPPAMVAFDAPARETCTVRESRTNTPLQALDVLNDVTFVEAARGFAEQIMHGPDRSPEAATRGSVSLRHSPMAPARRASHPGRRLSQPTRPVWPRASRGESLDQVRRVQQRSPARPGRARRLHGDCTVDPQPRRDAHQGVTHRGSAPRAIASY